MPDILDEHLWDSKNWCNRQTENCEICNKSMSDEDYNWSDICPDCLEDCN
jgi:hypothetical protein|tara:strand:- start:1 stop:150 length:150 start_codon:yes stop_codon:yes gene_type:complete